MSSNTTTSDDSSESFQNTGISIDSLHEDVVDTLSNVEWTTFDCKTDELHIDTPSNQSEYELEFAGYFDDPRNNDPPEQIGRAQAGGKKLEIDGQETTPPRAYTFDDYENALDWSKEHAIAHHAPGEYTVVLFISKTSCFTTIDATE